MTHDSTNRWTSEALARGDIEAIRQRVLANPNYVHERDDLGDTPLLKAIEFDDLALVQFLIAHGADPNISGDDGYTCLLSASESAATESTQIVRELIGAGADVNLTGINGWSPLHMAAASGREDKAKLLIVAGADVNMRSQIDASETPLMEAAFNGQPATVRLLLNNGADASMRDTIHNQTPLQMAKEVAKGPDPGIAKTLKHEFASIDFDDFFGDGDVPPDQLAWMKHFMNDYDMAKNYIDNSNKLVETGDHAEVIRILTEHAAQS